MVEENAGLFGSTLLPVRAVSTRRIGWEVEWRGLAVRDNKSSDASKKVERWWGEMMPNVSSEYL